MEYIAIPKWAVATSFLYAKGVSKVYRPAIAVSNSDNSAEVWQKADSPGAQTAELKADFRKVFMVSAVS